MFGLFVRVFGIFVLKSGREINLEELLGRLQAFCLNLRWATPAMESAARNSAERHMRLAAFRDAAAHSPTRRRRLSIARA